MSSARDKRWELRDRSFFSFGTSSFVWEIQQLTKKREGHIPARWEMLYEFDLNHSVKK